jgi:hypothetical protein
MMPPKKATKAVKAAKGDKPHKCAWCKGDITLVSATKIGRPPRFCSEAHKTAYWNADKKKKKATEAKRRAKAKANSFSKRFNEWLSTPVGFFIVSNVQRAGTAGILPDSVLELKALTELKIAATKANSFLGISGNEFEVSHIAPAVGRQGLVGLLEVENLVIAPTTRQRKHGNKPPLIAPDKGSKSLRTTKLTKQEANEEVRKHLLKKLTKAGALEYIKSCPRKSKSAVSVLLDSLLKQADLLENKQAIKAKLKEASLNGILALQQVADEYSLSYYIFERKAQAALDVYKKEAERQGYKHLSHAFNVYDIATGFETTPKYTLTENDDNVAKALCEQAFLVLHRQIPDSAMTGFYQTKKDKND